MKIDRDNIKIILILLILGLGIGYSYLNTDLAINGTANINSANWNVYWNNVQVSNGSVEATTPTIDTGKTTVNFNVTLAEPGDYYEFSVDAVNSGTLDAMIDTISSKLNGTTITTLPTYLEYDVTYSDGTSLEANQELLHDTTETYKVRLAYKDNISASDLPSTNQSLSLQFSVIYKQADDNSQAVEHRTTVYAVNINDRVLDGNSLISIGQSIPNNITQYSSATDAMAALENKPFYLKHVLINGIVAESYVEFIVTQDMANSNSGMTVGTYTLRGLDTNVFNSSIDDYECKSEYYNTSSGRCESPYYEANKQVLQTAFGSGYCSEYTDDQQSTYSCSVSNLFASSASNGNTIVSDSTNWMCSVSSDGKSGCDQINS